MTGMGRPPLWLYHHARTYDKEKPGKPHKKRQFKCGSKQAASWPLCAEH